MFPYFWHTFKMTFKNNFTKMLLCLKVRNVAIFLTLLETGMKSTTYRSVYKIRYQKKKIVKTWRDQDRLINHGNLVPLSETGVRENWKTLLTLQSPREARHRGTAGSWGLELVLSTSLTRWSHQPRVSKLAESGARHDLSIFWFVWQKSARPQNNANL